MTRTRRKPKAVADDLTREDLAPEAEFVLLGYGESSDAYHMSHPHPEGKGAIMAMKQSLFQAVKVLTVC